MLQKVIERSRRPRVSAAIIPVVAALTVVSTMAAPAQASGRAAASPPGTVALAKTDSCADFTTLSLPNTVIDSAVHAPAGTVVPPFPGVPPTPVIETCRVHATVTTPGVNDQIGVDVWMPVNGWNGRFQGAGGGGFLAGHPYFMA